MHYKKNLNLFARLNPVEAFRLDRIDCGQMEFCRTAKEELNLKDAGKNGPFYLHAPQGVLLEANLWMSGLPLEDTEALFVYGIGLGYYYVPLQQWLHANPKRFLIFIEDDPRVIYFFLQTELAGKILNDPQVMVQLYPFLREVPGVTMWINLRKQASSILWPFALLKPHVSALQAYFVSRFPFFNVFNAQWYANLSHAQKRLEEFLPNPHPAFHNFYANMPYLANALPASALYHELALLPMIICGAGPSLDKQIPLLKQMKDQALLLAAGSAITALTQAEILPHAAGACDPKLSQVSRQLSSFAFDVPLFYHNRYNSQALASWHGPLLYVEMDSSFLVSKWFDEELNHKKSNPLIAGVSASNLLAELAAKLGGNPIILVGMDLAYTNDKLYSKGVLIHPADEKQQQELITKKKSGLLAVPGIDGKKVYTRYSWFLEAACLQDFQLRNRDIAIINATEGGMPVAAIPNAALRDIAAELLDNKGDIEGWLHGIIQNAAKHAIPASRIHQAMKKWKQTLERCRSYLQLLFTDLKSNYDRRKKGNRLPYGPYSGKAVLWQTELQEEAGYRYLLASLNTAFDTLHLRRTYARRYFSKEKKRDLEEISYEMERCSFLECRLDSHLDAICKALLSFQKKVAEQFAPKLRDQRENKDGPLDPLKVNKTIYSYPSGKKKRELFFDTSKKLHGPCSFYAENDQLLARSWYVHGKKQGISTYYYADGALYRRQGYRNNVLHGECRAYYPDGILKTVETYCKGKREGIVQLFYSNGSLKRELHFSKGLLRGIERAWDEAGQLLFETVWK